MSEVCTGFRLQGQPDLLGVGKANGDSEGREVGRLVEWLTDMHTCQRNADIDI